jgi:CubicO group peptidase (beta-lactamase class C family)
MQFPFTRWNAMPLPDRADALLSNAVAAGDVPGAVAMATGRDGTLYEGAFGRRLLGQPAGMTLDTVCWLASMTKALTSVAAVQLVEQGRLDLDSPAGRWAPQLGTLGVLEGFDAAGAPRTRPAKRAITLRHLLTHTAGFGYPIWNADIARYQQVTGLPSVGTGKLAALNMPLLFDPGERWNYGIGIDWAGQLIEAAGGMKLGDYLRTALFEPIGMTSTAFKISASMRQRLAKMHQRSPDGALQPNLEFEVAQDPEFEVGGGGLYGTAGDYLKFIRMVLDGGVANGKRIIRPESLRLLTANQMGGLKVNPLKTANPALSNDAEFFPGVPKQWSCCFMINNETAPTGRSPGSLAWAGLGNTYYWIDPAKGIGGVYLSQVLPFVDVKSLPLFLEFEKTVYQAAG